jgi:hypothetical protein
VRAVHAAVDHGDRDALALAQLVRRAGLRYPTCHLLVADPVGAGGGGPAHHQGGRQRDRRLPSVSRATPIVPSPAVRA